MARLPRYVLPGQPQHVIQRGNNRHAVFGAEADYRYYLEKLAAAAGTVTMRFRLLASRLPRLVELLMARHRPAARVARPL